ncbi:MAG: flagellar motor protein MotB [Spirochaetales bacterium]|nr:flagellar motor protein MotB [Spirochaetales bacterium]
MPDFQRKKKCPPEGAADWLLTYGDMVTLLLTFFVMMFTVSEVDEHRLQLIIAAFSGLGVLEGGNTLEPGELAEMGHTVMQLPSQERGRALDNARKEAISQFQPEIKTQTVRVTVDERGLVISLAADSFFREASAEVDIEASRVLLQRIAGLLNTMPENKFAIEGHTDAVPTDPDSEYATNWELSSARATNVLHYLVDFGSDESKFQTRGFAATMPLMNNDTREGRAYNRRIDIVILSEGHL